MFIRALFNIARMCKHAKSSSTDGWIKKLWNIMHNGTLCNLKKKDNLSYDTVLRNIKNIMLCEIRRPQKARHALIPLIRRT